MNWLVDDDTIRRRLREVVSTDYSFLAGPESHARSSARHRLTSIEHSLANPRD
jgi:hypothetical protein